jgi:hypothetical protein
MSAKSAISPPVGSLLAGNCDPRGLTALYGRAGWGDLGHVSITVPIVRRSSIFVASISMARRMFDNGTIYRGAPPWPRC